MALDSKSKYFENFATWQDGGEAFKSIARAVGIFGIGVQTIMDIRDLDKADNLWQWALGLLTVLSANGLLLGALFLTGPAGLIATVAINIALAVMINFIKNLLLFAILEARYRDYSRRGNRYV